VKSTFAYQNGSTFSYVEVGDPNGFPILIQHGMIASIDDHHIFHRLIESGARLISIARPGYGASSPYALKNIGEWGEIVSALVAERGLAQFDVLGISSGAPYGYAIGHRLPEQVRNLFILSGTPALYDERVQSHWPYPLNQNATIPELQTLAHELFFAHLPEEALDQNDVKDSMANNCFGIAQDLKIRCMDWGFRLPDVKARVTMRHSRSDEAVPLITAELTAQLLPACRLEVRDHDPHFSQEVLDDFSTRIYQSRCGPRGGEVGGGNAEHCHRGRGGGMIR
jgi:pimeloyl-ACP methyl ester carboxylesterase